MDKLPGFLGLWLGLWSGSHWSRHFPRHWRSKTKASKLQRHLFKSKKRTVVGKPFSYRLHQTIRNLPTGLYDTPKQTQSIRKGENETTLQKLQMFPRDRNTCFLFSPIQFYQKRIKEKRKTKKKQLNNENRKKNKRKTKQNRRYTIVGWRGQESTWRRFREVAQRACPT